jgi:DNA-binding transcriptional MerR regulator
MSSGLTIAEVADRTGLTAHTLRYYERDGLLLAGVDRAPSGHRRYSEQDLAWITLITRLRSTGMPIRDVKQYAALVRAGDGNEEERLALLLAHRDRVEQRLAEVTGHLRAIDHKIALYEGRLEQRSVVEPGEPQRARVETVTSSALERFDSMA